MLAWAAESPDLSLRMLKALQPQRTSTRAGLQFLVKLSPTKMDDKKGTVAAGLSQQHREGKGR